MPTAEQFRALFEPRGIVIAGVSSHPAKFGFTALHHIRTCGYRGRLFALGRGAGSILGVPLLADLDQVPDSEVDLIFMCTPAETAPDLLRRCAKKGIRAAFVASAGFSETGDAGREAEAELSTLARELGVLLAGPNGMGVVSTPVSLCAQIQAPYPPAGRIAVVSQSGNFVMAFMNYARMTGIGISRAVSAGNAIAVNVEDYVEFFAHDPATSVTYTYVEGITDGRRFFERARAATTRKPLVLVKGGVSKQGQCAASSHTGALATDERIFDGACRQAGITRVATIEDAFEIAATFATQPLPRGPRTVVLTTAGGWGVLAADALAATALELISLPDDIVAAIDRMVPPRWSRSNPVDLAGGEGRDTIPEVLDLLAGHPDIDAVIFLGLGIQANTATLLRSGPFYPDYGLERVVAYHDRQDTRYARTAAEVADRYGKPVLCATELAIADPANAGVAAVRETGRLCYASAQRAVKALEHLWGYVRHRQARGLGVDQTQLCSPIAGPAGWQRWNGDSRAATSG